MSRIELLIIAVAFIAVAASVLRSADHISAPVPVAETDSPETQFRRYAAGLEAVFKRQRDRISELEKENWRLEHSTEKR